MSRVPWVSLDSDSGILERGIQFLVRSRASCSLSSIFDHSDVPEDLVDLLQALAFGLWVDKEEDKRT